MFSKELLEKFVRHSYLHISDDIKKRMREYYELVLRLEEKNEIDKLIIAEREFNIDILFYEGNVSVLKEICHKFSLTYYCEETIEPHFDDLLGLFQKGNTLEFMRKLFPTFKMSSQEVIGYNVERGKLKKLSSLHLYDFLND